MHARVGVDEGQILALLGREGFCRMTHRGHPIQLFVRALPWGGTDECTLSGRTQPNRARRTHSAFERGKHASRKLKRAQILLAADAGVSDAEIARNVGVGVSTVYRTKRRFVLGNLEAALSEELRPGARRKLTGKEEALLVATTCSSLPVGRALWTLKLLPMRSSS